MSDDQRIHPSKVAGDRASLIAFLDYQRATLAMKCQGLTGEQLKQKAVPTSGLSLLGLVRHAAEVERSWFRMVLNGEDCKALWPRTNGEFAEFHVDDADVDEAFVFWREACEGSAPPLTPSNPSTTRWTSGARSSRSAMSSPT